MALPTTRLGAADRPFRADAGWLLAIVAVALAIRIYFPWPLVFTPAHINLLETDAWYHLRVIENLVHQFPHRLRVDPYASPSGQFVAAPPLLDFIIAGAALIAGWGHPSTALVRTIAVFAPPALGGLTVLMVYAVGRLAGGSLAGRLAAALAAVLPGHFLDRTLLGFVDHHALESFVSTVVLYSAARPLTRAHSTMRSGVWLGLALAAFRLAWTSSAMIVAILIVWLAVHTALQSWRQAGVGDTARVSGMAVAIALPLTIAFRGIEPFLANLEIASLSILALVAATIEVGRRGLRAGWWSPRSLIVIAVVTTLAFAGVSVLAFPATVAATLGELSRFKLSGPPGAVLEARPLFMYDGTWSLRPAWDLFRSGFILGLGAIAFLAVRWARRGAPLDLLLIVWTVAMYAATIGMNRFGYYLVPAIAIGGGCACARLIEAGRRAGDPWRGAVVVAVAAGAFGLNVVPAISTTVHRPEVPAGWLPAFDWVRQHSEEPFGDANYYFARYDAGPVRSAAWTMMAWWDYGYILIAAGHRVPVAIPTQAGGVEAGSFFTATDEAPALELLEKLRARDVLVDEYLPFSVNPNGTLFGKFEGIAQWAGVPTGRFYDTFLFRETGGYRLVYLFFEDYYRTMIFRLGVLGGQGATPHDSTAVVSWTVENLPGMGVSRVVSSLEPYATHEAAAHRLQQLGPGNHAIVGRDPRASAVPLQPIRGLRRVYATPAAGAFGQGAVQVFEWRR